MTELRDELRRASHAVALPDQALDEMLRRGERRRRASRAGTAAFALGLSVLVLGGGLYGLTRLGGGTTGRVSAGGDLAMADGQYHYLRLRMVATGAELEGGAVSEGYDAQNEYWWALDDSGRIRTARETAGHGLPGDGTFGAGEFPVDDISHLSTDPATLRQQLTQRHAPNGKSPQPEITPGAGQDAETGKLVRDITYLLEWPNATPELRQALFQVAAGLPTVERRDGVQDRVGREAIELKITTENVVRTLYFDPATTLWMGGVEEFGPLMGEPIYKVVEASGFVTSTDEVPSGVALFFPEPQRELARI